MKKIIVPSVLLILVLTSCNIFGPSPQDILMKYLNSYYKGNYSETYALLSAKDKNFKNQKEYEAEFSDNPFSKLFAGKISFNVKEIKVNGNNAEATVEITGPDLSEATETYDLVKDNEGWRVFLNWEGQKKAVEISDKAKKAYFDKIEVRNIHLGTTGSFDAIGVFGEIKNNGDRTLKQVEVTAYCLDKNDKTVFEKTYHPVLVTNVPLKPNYSRRFNYELDNATTKLLPSDWSKKVKVAVTDTEFQ